MRLLVATTNPHKFREISEILKIPGLELLFSKDIPNVPAVVEDGSSFEENAAKKAREICLFSGIWTIADDSGLEVRALNWAPGVFSARYAGEPCDDTANNNKLIAALRNATDRYARFRCVISIANPKGDIHCVEGVCEGEIAQAPRGSGGFGYDPLFIPAGYNITFGEMPQDEKNKISHRGKALRAAYNFLRSILAQNR